LLVVRRSTESNIAADIFPDTEETRLLVKSIQSQIYFYLVDRQNNVISGYGLAGEWTPYRAPLLWKIDFSEEKIVGVAAYPSAEHVYHPAVILGDRNILPKYINKNLAAIATSIQTASGSALNIYIVDTVTGNVQYQTQHVDALGESSGSPLVSLTWMDHSLLYSYWVPKSMRYQLSVIDLFERSVDWQSTEISSYTSESPVARQQTFILPTGVSVLAHTTTQKGITAKNLLLGLKSGQIVSLDKRWVDSRRPLPAHVTAADKEEQLIPYSPRLYFPSLSHISYNHTIQRLRTISTQGTYLESTSLMFATGLDLYFTRVSPAEAYDLLNGDFNFSALITTITILVVSTTVLTHLSRKKDLRKLWK